MNAIGALGWVLTLVCFSSFAPPALSADALAVVLTLDTFPGTEQAIGLLCPRAFERGDRAGVVAVGAGEPRVLMPPSEDRNGLASALQRAGVRVGASAGPVSINNNRTVEIASAIKLACHQLQEDELKSGRRAIILLFGTPDPGLAGQMQTLRSFLMQQVLACMLWPSTVQSNRTELQLGFLRRIRSAPRAGTGALLYRKRCHFQLQLHRCSNNWRRTPEAKCTGGIGI